MGVLRDFSCLAHGVFESSEASPKCPYGCNSVQPVFLKAPAVRTNGRTANIDSTLDSLAAQFGLTDLSTRNGSVMNSIKPHSKPDHVAASYRSLYGDPRTEMLTPRFASPNEVTPMMDGGPRALAMKDKNGVGLGDVLHDRMGHRNVDPMMTMIQAETSKDDNAKLSAAMQGQAAA